MGAITCVVATVEAAETPDPGTDDENGGSTGGGSGTEDGDKQTVKVAQLAETGGPVAAIAVVLVLLFVAMSLIARMSRKERE